MKALRGSQRFYKRIEGWEFKCLSIAGRAVLAQSVLAQITVYWAHLYYLLSGIIANLNRLMANFIWGGGKHKNKYHLTSLSKITLPKILGGWGIMNIRNFCKALLCKAFWRSINGVSFWSAPIRRKYMEDKDLTYWYRVGTIGKSQGSAIWNSLRYGTAFTELNPLYLRIYIGISIMVNMCS